MTVNHLVKDFTLEKRNYITDAWTLRHISGFTIVCYEQKSIKATLACSNCSSPLASQKGLNPKEKRIYCTNYICSKVNEHVPVSRILILDLGLEKFYYFEVIDEWVRLYVNPLESIFVTEEVISIIDYVRSMG
jgi:hypothetical protein